MIGGRTAAVGALFLASSSAGAVPRAAVLDNGRVRAVFHRGAPAVEWYAKGKGGDLLRARLRVAAASGSTGLALVSANSATSPAGASVVETTWQAAGGAAVTARFTLKRREPVLLVEPGAGAARLRVEAPGRFAVVPDFFADDIVLDARTTSGDWAEVPSENFLLHLTGDGNSIVQVVFEKRDQEARVSLEGAGSNRRVTGSDISFGTGGKVWVTLLEGRGIWHAFDVDGKSAGKIVNLGWTMPFTAQWRVNFTRVNGLTDSWEMLVPRKKGKGYVKPGWLGYGDDELEADRKRWTTVLGEFPYPCWSDARGRGFVQPLEQGDELSADHTFRGPALVYPINRMEKTPVDSYTVVDVVRATLGMGPCAYILDVEGQAGSWKGMATCGTRDTLNPIFEKGRQREKRAEIQETLDKVLVFVKYIRSRIESYRDFSHQLAKELEERRAAHPEAGAFLDEMDRFLKEIDTRYEARREKIKTPDDVAKMNEDFRERIMVDESPGAKDKCKAWAEALVEVGSNQDELAGECRWLLKNMRQRAGVLMAAAPAVAPLAEEIRAKVQVVLRNPAGHEGARH